MGQRRSCRCIIVVVGIDVGGQLEHIVRGIEEIDGVPGRCELIYEEQVFGVLDTKALCLICI
ncbi:unnamed protein product [Linum tenue]|uniref:Uncharacterized protein n=1 Tax=Linum tenue TaxID=586396 RepID=A0AAV0IW36_9ROSI|nr:unnamed protein product [Linum tenue]